MYSVAMPCVGWLFVPLATVLSFAPFGLSHPGTRPANAMTDPLRPFLHSMGRASLTKVDTRVVFFPP